MTLFLCVSAHAGSNSAIRLATYIEPPMVNFVNGNYFGENIDVVRLLAKALNKELTFIQCPVARCLAMIEAGEADMIVSVRKTPEREKYATFLERPFKIQHYPLRFFLRATDNTEIIQYSDLKPLAIGVLRGASYFDLFDHDNTLNKVELTERKQLVSMLLKGRVDTFLEREESIKPLVTDVDYYQEIKLAKYQYTKNVGSYIAISKKSALHQDAEAISNTLSTLIESGAIQTLLAK